MKKYQELSIKKENNHGEEYCKKCDLIPFPRAVIKVPTWSESITLSNIAFSVFNILPLGGKYSLKFHVFTLF